MAFFYRHNPKKFNYIPRYYNPEEQAWEEKKAAAGLDSKLTHEEQLRAQMRREYDRCSKQGYAMMGERDDFENCWVQYHALGANGVMDDIHSKFLALPIGGGEE